MSKRYSPHIAARFVSLFRVAALFALLCAQISPLAMMQPAVAAAATPQQPAAPNIEATKTDALASDADGDGRADAGDTLRYTVTLSNTGSTDATGVTLNDALDANTALVPGSLRVSPLAFADNYTVLRNTPRTVAAPGVLANDTGTPAPTVTPRTSAPTTAGGSVTINADGSFSYTPPLDYVGPDSFLYTVSNPLGSDSATVSITAEAAPAVASTTPTAGDTAVPANSAIVVNFDEPVNVTAAAFTLGCPTSVPFTVSPAGPATSYTLDPTSDLPVTVVCTVTVVAAEVSDADPLDPPDSMASDYSWSFTTTDAAPVVETTIPADAATNVAITTTLSVQFSESVAASTSSFTLLCANVAQNFAVSPSPAASFTLTPTVALPEETGCMLSVLASQVSDSDTVDPPDAPLADYSMSFTTDAAPRVLSTTPADNATLVTTNSTIVVNFSESVNADVNAFVLECPAGTPIAFTISASPASSFTLTPSAALPASAVCNGTVIAANITDVDSGDPPDTLAANYLSDFTTVDPAPRVTNTTPISNATNLAIDSNIVVQFSEPVAASNGSFSLVCASVAQNFTLSAAPASSYTLNPTSDLPVGAGCTVTVLAAQVSDSDTVDPPDTMLADYVFDFSTDSPPSVMSTTPTNSTSGVTTAANIVLNFSEPVAVSGAWFGIVCTVSGTRAVADTAVTGGPTSYTINPTSDFAAGETCTVTVVAAQVADSDTDDPPDTMLSNYLFDFSTDAAPEVSSSSPADNATGVPTNANLNITFSEPVAVSGAWFGIVCTVSGTRAVADMAVTGGPTSYTINPTSDFAAGETCTVTVVAAQVADSDTNDPPDTMVVNYVFDFSTDAAPSVSSTTPADNAVGVATASSIVLNFSEPVAVSGEWFGIVCAVSGTRAVADTAVTGGPTSYTINPTSDFVAGETCSVTVVAAQVADSDTNDPPDTMLANYVFDFGTEAPPEVLSTTPADNATGVTINANIVLNFSEPVAVSGEWFGIVCAVSGTRAVADSTVTGGPTSYTINPTSNFAAGEACTVTVVAAQVADSDSNDPPDTMLANYVFDFSTDAAPSVTSTTPADNATGVTTNANLSITFSEPVAVSGEWFGIVCTVSGTRAVADTAVTGGPSSYTINPTSDFAPGETCTVTVVAAQVADSDSNDPPDSMAANYLFDFSTDAAPSVSSTTPANGATGVVSNANLQITFSEPVAVSGEWFGIVCTVSGTRAVADTAVTGGPTSYTINPTSDFAAGETCTVTVVAAQVADSDTNDPPDTMLANYVWSFSTDAAPAVSSTTPANGAINVPFNASIVVNFSEPVVVSGEWFGIVCAVSGTRAVADTAVTGGPSSYTIAPTVQFATNELCTVTVYAAQVADSDSNDPPDNLAANYVWSFTSVDDAAPSVSSSTPADNATGVTTNANLGITFSEPVAVSGEWFGIVCTVSGTRAVADTAVTGGPTSYTINPTSDFAAGETCSVTVVAAQVADSDAIDPPDNLAANYLFDFSTDAAPAVSSSTPSNGSVNIASNANLLITFSEPVVVSGAWFGIVCAVSGTRAVADTAVTGGPTSYTINPTSDFAPGETCSVTIVAAQVADSDANDPPDTMLANYLFIFATDAAPSVTSTTPVNGASNRATNTALSVTFSEPVDVSGAWFGIVCTVSGTRAVADTVVTGGPLTFTITPTVALAQGETCTTTIYAAQVSDSDTNDPPDTMLANYVWSFSTDVAPSVTSTTPVNGANGVLTSATITINFSESVNAAAGAFTLECPSGTSRIFTGSASPASSFVLTPSAALPAGAVCTVTVVAANITDVDSGDPPDTMAANYVFSFNVPPVANNDSYPETLVGNMPVNSANTLPAAYSAVTNDSFASPVTITAYDATSVQGGSITMVTSGANVGQFSYNPPAGYEGSDSFTYTIGNAAGSSIGTVSLTISGMIWFVNNAAAPGDGRFLSPFNTLGAFAAVNDGVGNRPAASDNIFIYEVASNYGGPLTLLNNQRLIGQDATATVASLSGLTRPSSSPPFPVTNSGNATLAQIVGGGITLALNNHLHGFTLFNTGGTALAGNAFGDLTLSAVTISTTSQALNLANGNAASVVFASITSSAGTNNIALTSVNGPQLTLGSGALSGATATAFNVVGGTAVIAYSGSVTSSAASPLVVVDGKTAGSVTLSGAVSSNNRGVALTNNTGATIAFSGGLTLSTGTNPAFTATGGGTVAVTGSANTISTSTGVAVNIVNTTIGASGITLRSVSVNGAANGIILNNTGSGGFTITGTGSAGSGGTIQNIAQRGASFTQANAIQLNWMNFSNAAQNNGSGCTTLLVALDANTNLNCNAAIYLVNSSNVTLANMLVEGSAQHGINGNAVTNFTLSNSEVRNNGNAVGENGVTFVNLLGNSFITNANLHDNPESQMRVQQNSAGGTLTVLGSTFAKASAGVSGNSGLMVSGDSNGSLTVQVQTSAFSANYASGYFSDTSDNATLNVTVQSSTFANNNNGINIGTAGSSDIVFNVTGNTVTSNRSQASAINIYNGTGTGNTLRGSVQNNNVGTAGVPQSASIAGDAIRAIAQGNGTLVATITGNIINGVGGTANRGIYVHARDGSAAADVLIQNNTVNMDAGSSGAANAIQVQSGATVTDATNVCADIRTNTTNNNSSVDEIRVRNRFVGTLFRLPGYGGAGNDVAAVAAFLAGNNTLNGGTASATINANTFGGGAPCATPLLAAGGEGPGAPASTSISQAQLDAMVAEARARWQQAGIAPIEQAQLAMAEVRVADLQAGRLGQTLGTQVEIDRDAAGWGWFVDATPAADAEFAAGSVRGVDLLTVVLHEFGHMLGRADLEHSPQVMNEQLPTGTRRTQLAPQQANTLTVDIGTLPAGKRVVITFEAQIVSPVPAGVTQVANQATVTGSNLAAMLTDDPDTTAGDDPTITPLDLPVPATTSRLLLPLVAKAGGLVALPDLVVERISFTNGSLEVVLRNQGAASVSESFWVDLYVNPSAPPTQVNQIWQALGDSGAVWAVKDGALPIAAGGTLTVRVGDSLYDAAKSSLPASLVAGTQLYVQVDSANTLTNYGGVLETHERDGAAYNNVRSAVVPTGGVTLPRAAAAPTGLSNGLPPRP